jgi:transcriptional regulator GlxA family with amidase domain
MDIAILVYDDFTALDAVGPYEVLSRLPGARVRFVAKEAGPVVTDNGMLRLLAEASLAEVPEPDIVVIAGGVGTRRYVEDEEILGWIRHAHEHSTWTTSVCTGSLLLGAAGVLEGLTATTHWLERETLRDFGATPVADRVVFEGKVVTAAGVSAGIDMALHLVERIVGPEAAQAVQLVIEYDPQPPFDTGSPEKAPAEIVDGIRAAVQARNEAAKERAVAGA